MCCSAAALLPIFSISLQAVPTRGYIHLDFLELINWSSLQPKGSVAGKEILFIHSFFTIVNEYFLCMTGLGCCQTFFLFCDLCFAIIFFFLFDGAEDKLTSTLRETPRDSVLLPQEHKRQTREKVFGSAESYAKDSSQYTVYQ